MVRSAVTHGLVTVLCDFGLKGLFFRFFRLLGLDRLEGCSLRANLLFLVLLAGFIPMQLLGCLRLLCFQEAVDFL